MKLSQPLFRLKRNARLLARAEGIPLHAALDRVAQREGASRWGLLAERVARATPVKRLLAKLSPGELILLGARPGQGKTLLGLHLLVEAVLSGRHGAFFSLEYTRPQIEKLLQSLGMPVETVGDRLTLVTSDEVCAKHIIATLSAAPPHAVAIIDYLQVLDQRRTNPSLSEQVTTLCDFAQSRGAIIAFISQIDRSYDPSVKPFPGMADVRLPNPVDLTMFAKACFLNGGEIKFEVLTRQ